MQRVLARFWATKHTATWAASCLQRNRPIYSSLGHFTSLSVLLHSPFHPISRDEPSHRTKGLLTALDKDGFENMVVDAMQVAQGKIVQGLKTKGGDAIGGIVATNLSVYSLWKIAPADWMARHFTTSVGGMALGRYYTAITCNFSHMGLLHLVVNMSLLLRFGPDVAESLGSERFLLFYVVSGIASALTSLAYRRWTRSRAISLGASGAIAGLLWVYSFLFPDTRFSFLGSEKSITAQEMVIAYAIVDVAGMLGAWGSIDFAAHLGGAGFANLWYYAVREDIAEEQSGNEKPISLFEAVFGNGSNSKK